MRWLVALLPLLACVDPVSPEPPDGDPPPAEEPPPLMPPIETGSCGFEEGDLGGFRHPGEDWVVYDDGAQIGVVEEGAEFSAFYGEQLLNYPGNNALLMRPGNDSPADAVAFVRTNPFRPSGQWFAMDQLSEVGDHGIALSLRFLNQFGDELEVRELEVHTGGFVPQLLEQHGPLPGFEEIDYKSYRPGEFTRTWIDLAPYDSDDEPLVLEFQQRTLAEGLGFFTLLDNLCHGDPIDPPDV